MPAPVVPGSAAESRRQYILCNLGAQGGLLLTFRDGSVMNERRFSCRTIYASGCSRFPPLIINLIYWSAVTLSILYIVTQVFDSPLYHCAMAQTPLPLRRTQAPPSKKWNVLRTLAPPRLSLVYKLRWLKGKGSPSQRRSTYIFSS